MKIWRVLRQANRPDKVGRTVEPPKAMCRSRGKDEIPMKAKRIQIKKDESVEIYLRRRETPSTTCDNKRTGVRADLKLVGPVLLNLVVSKRKR
jgi:hypothetical protein